MHLPSNSKSKLPSNSTMAVNRISGFDELIQYKGDRAISGRTIERFALAAASYCNIFKSHKEINEQK